MAFNLLVMASTLNDVSGLGAFLLLIRNAAAGLLLKPVGRVLAGQSGEKGLSDDRKYRH